MSYKKAFIILSVLILVSSFFFTSITSMRQKSATFDEACHLAAGYSYLLARDYRMNPEHPPLMKMLNALPLLIYRPILPTKNPSWENVDEYQFGEDFLYKNKIDADFILFLGRLPSVILSIFLSFFVFKWANELYGVKSAIFALFLYVFCPNIIAHSQLVTTDLAGSCFVFLSLYFFWRLIKQKSMLNTVLAGVSLGFALASRFTTLILFPAYLLVYLEYLRENKIRPKLNINFIFILIIASLILILVYRVLHINTYFIGLKRIIWESTTKGPKIPVNFLLGNYSTAGWRYFFVVCFLFKTPVPFILLVCFYPFVIRKLNVKDNYFLLIPILLIFLNVSLSKKQFGLRYMLPVYPLLYVLVSVIINYPLKLHFKQVLLFLFCGLYLFSSVKTYPHYLAYVNELVGGPKNGWKIFADSNIDWGQDLKELATFIKKEGNPELILSYFGSANPNYYGIKYQKLFFSSLIPRPYSKLNSLNPKKELLAISVTHLQCVYCWPDKKLFNWLKKKKIVKQIGYSINVYDITNDINAHENLALIYYNNGFLKEAERHVKRLLILQKNNETAHFVLSCFYAYKGIDKKALSEFNKTSYRYLPKIYRFPIGEMNIPDDLFHQSLISLSAILFKSGDLDNTERLLNTILKIYPKSVTTYQNLIILYLKKGMYNKAFFAIQELLNLDPNNQVGKNYLKFFKPRDL